MRLKRLDGKSGCAVEVTLSVIGGQVTANYLQARTSGTPTMNIDQGGSISVVGNFDFNSGSSSSALNIGKGTLTVGGTMLQGGAQTIYYTVPADQELGTITVGTMKHTSTENTVNIRITDDTLANGKTYVLLTDKSKTLGLADYTVLYNGEPAAEKGTLKIEEGVLTFQPTPTATVWTGAGDGVHFSDGRNWSTGAAPESGSSIYFQTVAGGALVNDLAGLSLLRLQFSAGTGAFTISGNPLVMDGPVVNRSAETQTLACVVTTPEGHVLSDVKEECHAGAIFELPGDDVYWMKDEIVGFPVYLIYPKHDLLRDTWIFLGLVALVTMAALCCIALFVGVAIAGFVREQVQKRQAADMAMAASIPMVMRATLK